jgi:hypothetical protein
MDGLISAACNVLVQRCLYLVLLDCTQAIAFQGGAEVCLCKRFMRDDGDSGPQGPVLL